jgi:hypothetical protein
MQFVACDGDAVPTQLAGYGLDHEPVRAACTASSAASMLRLSFFLMASPSVTVTGHRSRARNQD